MKTVIWRIHDHKPGHANQTRGLVRALSSLTDIESHDIPTPTTWRSWFWWLVGTFPPGNDLPPPNLIVGAGHMTHVPVLAARRAYGGRAIVLMRPSLPLRLFDLCIVPEHDGISGRADLIRTRGVLNVIEPSTARQSSRGLMLIGGPSANCSWDDDAMIDQVLAVARGQPALHWTLTTSRRTPADFVTLLSAERPRNLSIVPCDQTGPGWVPQELSRSAQVWVSEDSVSMVYEALTSGAAVGLFSVLGSQRGRVAEGMRELQQTGWVTHFREWDRRSPLPSPPGKLHEALRCAELICDRYQLPHCGNQTSRLAG
jgi:mitochondrial fission protein ELM1